MNEMDDDYLANQYKAKKLALLMEIMKQQGNRPAGAPGDLIPMAGGRAQVWAPRSNVAQNMMPHLQNLAGRAALDQEEQAERQKRDLLGNWANQMPQGNQEYMKSWLAKGLNTPGAEDTARQGLHALLQQKPPQPIPPTVHPDGTVTDASGRTVFQNPELAESFRAKNQAALARVRAQQEAQTQRAGMLDENQDAALQLKRDQFEWKKSQPVSPTKAKPSKITEQQMKTGSLVVPKQQAFNVYKDVLDSGALDPASLETAGIKWTGSMKDVQTAIGKEAAERFFNACEIMLRAEGYLASGQNLTDQEWERNKGIFLPALGESKGLSADKRANIEAGLQANWTGLGEHAAEYQSKVQLHKPIGFEVKGYGTVHYLSSPKQFEMLKPGDKFRKPGDDMVYEK